MSGSLSEPFGYKAAAGYYTDTETGLQLLTLRYYDPNSGRFLTRDPIGYNGGINLYAYVANNPTNLSDPRGLDDADLEWERRVNPSPPVGDPWYWSHNESADNPPFEADVSHSPCAGGWGMIGAIADFWGNYNDMRAANTIGADISEFRELFDEYIKGDPRSVCDDDRYANSIGRVGGTHMRTV